MSPDAWEEPLPTLTVRAWAFGTMLAAGVALAPGFVAMGPAEARRPLFADADPALASRIAGGDVLVAEEHRGDEGDARAACAALHAAGVVALLGRCFAPAVERAAGA